MSSTERNERKKSARLSPLANPHDVNLPASPLPGQVQLAGIACFGALIVLAIAFSLTDHWRRASFVFGLSLLWLALLRLSCDSQVLGILTVRSRRFDSIFEALLGSAMVFLAFSIDSLRG